MALWMTPVETPAQNGPVVRRGTDILHYSTRNDLLTTSSESNLVGSIRMQQNEQGHSSKQTLQINASGLASNAPYRLIAVVEGNTNTIAVHEFVTDSKGRGRILFRSRGQGNGGKNPVPEEFSPLTNLRSLGIENSATQTVAYTWIADADKFQFTVKRNLTPDDGSEAQGSVSLIANPNNVRLRLLAGGLTAGSDYHLALNSNIVSTATADANGRLELRDWPANAPGVLDLRWLALLDGGSNSVLHTALPK